jgi:glutamyl/glutaminyl-tRNA synthetase
MAGRDYKNELLKLVNDVNEWTQEHLEEKHPAIAKRVYLHSFNLQYIAEERPEEEARAAMHGADMMLTMLLEDAYRGQAVRHLYKNLPGTMDDQIYIDLLDKYHEEDPGNITHLRKLVAAELDCTVKTVKNHTRINGTLYDPNKK